MNVVRPLLKPKVAILYQLKAPPVRIDGVCKPLKPGGYSDSGADIAYQLKSSNITVVTPVPNPSVDNDFDWVFPDNADGIQDALNKSATVLWLNTVLYKGHPVESFFGQNIEFVGQLPSVTDLHDDKFYTNNFLRDNGLSFPSMKLVKKDQKLELLETEYACVLKPLRGRGSQGVVVVKNEEERELKMAELFACQKYGDSLYIEKYFEGQEVTVTVMPSGKYTLSESTCDKMDPWCLPVVKRFNHVDGIVPYSGKVAVMDNSCVVDETEQESKEVNDLCTECIKVFSLLKVRAPIRVDARADANGKYWIFDVNMKPNMTGPSRMHRVNQDNLLLMAARKIGWDYGDFLVNILNQRWK